MTSANWDEFEQFLSVRLEGFRGIAMGWHPETVLRVIEIIKDYEDQHREPAVGTKEYDELWGCCDGDGSCGFNCYRCS
ncbi:hypothetical protein [Mycobacteroides abscessus]|uniref:hypothetical protein n=1 Tax=Mycobacteroides abscessus TaxID=36809 RepID=UPI000C26B6D7|nr:hypothetical protein [Mycobacteroides abscessus]